MKHELPKKKEKKEEKTQNILNDMFFNPEKEERSSGPRGREVKFLFFRDLIIPTQRNEVSFF